MNLRKRVADCRARSRAWLEANGVEGRPREVKRFSSAHDVYAYPGMLLPATYNAAHCLHLLGAFNEEDPEALSRTADFINGFQMPDGRYRIPEMRDSDVFKREDLAYTWEYIDFHVTNYAAGAVMSIGGRPRYTLSFMDPYLTPEGLESWISRRMMDDPWMEGNNIVNIGSFYLMLLEGEDKRAGDRLEELFRWLDATQDPQTGFWGPELSSRKGLLHGMAGAMHTFHIYYYLDREIPYLDRIADSCLSLIRGELDGPTSACLDVDIVDVLANIYRLGLRRWEIRDVLEKKIVDLLDLQNPDGGFPDGKRGILRFDGWVKGYAEPQGLSNCFATWFRCSAVGIASCVLFPETAEDWNFRNTIGIGYFKKPR